MYIIQRLFFTPSEEERLFMLYDPTYTKMIKINGKSMSAALAYKKGLISAEEASKHGIKNFLDLERSTAMLENGGGYSLSDKTGEIKTRFEGGQKKSNYGQKVNISKAERKKQLFQAGKNNYLNKMEAGIRSENRRIIKEQYDNYDRLRLRDAAISARNKGYKAGLKAGKNSVGLIDALKRTAKTTRGKVGLAATGATLVGSGVLIGRATKKSKKN